jgi:hypothetical protein
LAIRGLPPLKSSGAEVFVATRGVRLAGFRFVVLGLFFVAAIGKRLPRASIRLADKS